MLQTCFPTQSLAPRKKQTRIPQAIWHPCPEPCIPCATCRVAYSYNHNICIYIHNIYVNDPVPRPPTPPWYPLPTHTHTKTHMHIYLHTFLYTYVHTCLPTYMPTYRHTYLPTSILTNLPTYIPIFIHTCTHAFIHA